MPERGAELLADAEIRDDEIPVLVDEDIVRLDILVDDRRLLGMEISQSGRHVIRETPEIVFRHFPGEPRNGTFRAERHDQVRTTVFLVHAQVIGMKQIGMVQFKGKLELLLEILQTLLVHRHIDLRRHFQIRRLVGRDPDLTETAAADKSLQLVTVIE